MMRRTKAFVPKPTLWLVNVYNAIILPYYDYCNLAWDNCSKYVFDKMQKMPNRAARIITGRLHEISASDVLNELGWQPLVNRRQYLCSK